MLIYSHTVTPRLQYVVDFLSLYFGQSFMLTTDWQYFQHSDRPKLNYTDTNADAQVLWVQPHGLLSFSSIKEIEVTCFDHEKGYKAFFSSQGVMGFDLFAAVFYLLTRYEEYRPHQKDEYGRYAYHNSIAFKNNFLHLPLINIWLEDFKSVINNTYPHSQFLCPQFQFLPTYDIDIAWSYQHKGLLRTIGGTVRSMIHKEWTMVKERANVLSGKAKDPFDSYEWLHALHQEYQLKPLYFFHVGQRRTLYDKNIATRNKAFQQLVKQHADRYTVGVHPSWHSGDDTAYVKKEKDILTAIAQQPVTASRQHYIRFSLPHTFRQLIAAGITHEYSMGYGSINGFRASVATPYYWYDLEKEEKTFLLLHPFCFMDANAFFEQQQTAVQALESLMHYYEVVKKVNGTFISIWHNNFLGTDPLYKGWREMYRQFIKQF